MVISCTHSRPAQGVASPLGATLHIHSVILHAAPRHPVSTCLRALAVQSQTREQAYSNQTCQVRTKRTHRIVIRPIVVTEFAVFVLFAFVLLWYLIYVIDPPYVDCITSYSLLIILCMIPHQTNTLGHATSRIRIVPYDIHVLIPRTPRLIMCPMALLLSRFLYLSRPCLLPWS